MIIKFKAYKMIGKTKIDHAWHLPILWLGFRKDEFSIAILGICFVVYFIKDTRQ